jgi:hypothetical protein
MTSPQFKCGRCDKLILLNFNQICNCCAQLDKLRCFACRQDLIHEQTLIDTCGGCGYAVCRKHSQKLFYEENFKGGGDYVHLCYFGSGTFTACRDQFLLKLPADQLPRLSFDHKWFCLKPRQDLIDEAQLAMALMAQKRVLADATEQAAGATVATEKKRKVSTKDVLVKEFFGV